MNENLNKLYELIGHKIRSDYALIAITCSAYANENGMVSQDSLAIVGDHVIKLTITSRAMNKNMEISKKDITNEYQNLETNQNLEEIGKKLKINEFLLCLSTDLNGSKKLATSIEAIIGAIYLSEGMDKAINFEEKIGLITKNKISILDIIDRSLFEKRLSEMDEYGYKSLVFCVVDSVYSLASNYTSTKNTVARLAKYMNIGVYDQLLVSEFNSLFSNMDAEQLANNVFENRQRTSATNGILKAEAVVSFLKVLQKFGIETTQDFLEHKNDIELLTEIKKIKGQTYGTTFDYVLMLSGDTVTFKRDRHIINFFKDYLGVLDDSYENLNLEFEKQLREVKIYYPDYDVRTLDGVIWEFMSAKK